MCLQAAFDVVLRENMQSGSFPQQKHIIRPRSAPFPPPPLPPFHVSSDDQGASKTAALVDDFTNNILTLKARSR